MCKVLCIACFSLFLVNIESYDIQDGPQIKEDFFKLDHITKSTLNDVERKPSHDGAESNQDIEETNVNIRDKTTVKPVPDDISTNLEELTPNTTENNFGRTGDIPRTIFVGSLAKTQQIRADESSSSDDYPDANNSDKESKFGNSDNLSDDAEHSNETGEIFMHTPNRKSLSQDAVLDLKARTGLIRSDEDDSNGNSNLSDITKIVHLPHLNTGSRSGYIPDEVADVLNPVYRTISPHSNHQLTQLNKPKNARLDLLHNAFNTRPRHYPYFESISSREMLYPILNSREIWAQGNTGQRTQNNIGRTYPNNQIYPRYRDRCPKCIHGRMSSREHSYTRSGEETSSVLQTANGRSTEFDPLGANSYPLEQDKEDELKEVNVNRGHSSNEILSSGSRETHASHEVERNVQLSNVQSDPGPFSKRLLTLPSYVPSSSTLLRRVGLGGVQRFVK